MIIHNKLVKTHCDQQLICKLQHMYYYTNYVLVMSCVDRDFKKYFICYGTKKW